MTAVAQKKCPRCEIMFARERGRSYCKPCASDVNRDWRERNPERARELERRKWEKRKARREEMR